MGYQGHAIRESETAHAHDVGGRRATGIHACQVDYQETQEGNDTSFINSRAIPHLLLRSNSGKDDSASQHKTRSAILESYWQVEQNAPRWFKDSSSVWEKKDELDFCEKCHSIYEVGNTLVYIEDSGEIHFSAKGDVDVQSLITLKDDLLQEFDFLFGWILKQNRGMRKVAEQIGFEYDGLRMLKGSSNGRVLEWYCYKIS